MHNTKSVRFILFITTAIGLLVLPNTILAGDLTKQKAHGAVWRFMNGDAKELQVVGVRELPQQNAAQADLIIKDWRLARPKNDAITAYALGPGGGTVIWSGRGTAIFLHYNDGTWVLTSISIDAGTWNNLNIPVNDTTPQVEPKANQMSGTVSMPANGPATGDITVVQALDMISFDPIATSDLNNQYVLYNIYSRLFTYPKNRLAGDVKELCKDFKRVSNTEWHFTIWENVKYHDGTTLTVDDVVYSLNRAKASAALGALFKPVKEIKKVDNKTLSITTDGPYPAMTSALTHAATCIVPKSYAEKAEKTKDWSKPVGSGRYKFVSRMIGDSVKFERFDGYFNKDELAQNKTVTIKVIPEGTNRTIAIETGAADLNAEFTPTDYERVMKNPKLKLWDQPSALVWHLGMDNTQGWFKNKLVRQAVAFAVDREGAMKVGHDGRGVVLYNSATFAHAPTVLGAIQNPLNKYSYNRQKAKALMKEANCPGFTTQLVVFRDEAERIATAVQAYLAEINIKVEIVRIENAVFPSLHRQPQGPHVRDQLGLLLGSGHVPVAALQQGRHRRRQPRLVSEPQAR